MGTDQTTKLSQSFDTVHQQPFFKRRAGFVSVTFLMGVGNEEYLVSIDKGRVGELKKGPLLTPSYEFSVRASAETWDAFWAAKPAPGMNDILALLKKGLMKFEGNLHPLMSNLFFFKELLASPRYSKGN